MKIIPRLARVTLVDVPLLIPFSILLILCWIRFVHDECLTLLRDAVNFRNSPRRFHEMTFYDRYCTEEDVSTSNIEDVMVQPHWTDKEATENVLYHGMSIFPGLVSPETAAEARAHILERNERTPISKQHIIIKQDNRWSYSGSPNEHPSIARALSEVANHPILRPTIENIMGRNPALLEIQVMTAAYMAEGQHFHSDTVTSGNNLLYSRTFGPHYTIFIPLQDTTFEMGPTSVCPGTHYCYEIDTDICEERGFPVSGKPQNRSHAPVWKSGYGALANQQMFHRGSHHWGHGMPNRVVMILTFTPRPAARGETRLPSLGTLWALPWHGWGHTMDDMADAENGAMSQPWAAMRSLGLYKPKHREWGWDWITVNTARIANDDNGYEREDLEDYFLVDGWGFINWTLVPRSLFGELPDEGNAWEEFLVDTVDQWIYWTAIINVGLIAVYLFVLTSLSFCTRLWTSYHKKDKGVKEENEEKQYNELQHNGTNGVNGHNGINSTNDTNGHNGISTTNGINGHNGTHCFEKKEYSENGNGIPNGITNIPCPPDAPTFAKRDEGKCEYGTVKRAILRLFFTYFAVSLLFAKAVHQVWTSGWASDLRSDMLFSPPFQDKERLYENEIMFDDYLEASARPRRQDILIGGTVVAPGYDTHFLDYHTGNIAWRGMIKGASVSLGEKPIPSNSFTSALIDSIVWELVSMEDRRFLVQDTFGGWTPMTGDGAREVTRMALMRETNEMIRSLDDQLLSLFGDARYGPLRGKDLTDDHVLPYLEELRKTIYSVSGGHLLGPPQWNDKVLLGGLAPLAERKRLRADAIPNVSHRSPAIVGLSMQTDILRPIGRPRVSDCHCRGNNILNLLPRIKRTSGGIFEVDEIAEVWEGGDSIRWILCEIISVNDDGTYDIFNDMTEAEEENVPPTDLRKIDALDMDLEGTSFGPDKSSCSCN